MGSFPFFPGVPSLHGIKKDFWKKSLADLFQKSHETALDFMG